MQIRAVTVCPAKFQKERERMKALWEASEFVHKWRGRMRFGKLSRAPLKLLRFEVRGEVAECEWMARPADAWDADFPRGFGARNASSQALEDSLAVREMLFATMPGVSSAVFRVYRAVEAAEASEETGAEAELIIVGTVERDEQVAGNIRSLAMRAQLFGFRFWMDNGILGTLQSGECALSS
jgi:hypothetical protein